jgi:hypothetical protein
MREWRHATTRIPCGCVADCWIKPGELHCVFTQEDWLSAKYRCRQHAGCEPPEDVPQLPTHDQIVGLVHELDTLDKAGKLYRDVFVSVKHLASAAERDVKMAQAGERDDA